VWLSNAANSCPEGDDTIYTWRAVTHEWSCNSRIGGVVDISLIGYPSLVKTRVQEAEPERNTSDTEELTRQICPIQTVYWSH